MEKSKLEYRKIGSTGFEIKTSAKQRFRYKGCDVDLDNPDEELLKELAEKKGKLVRKIASDQAKDKGSSSSSSTGK